MMFWLLSGCVPQYLASISGDLSSLEEDGAVCVGLRAASNASFAVSAIGMDSHQVVTIVEPTNPGGVLAVDGMALLPGAVAWCGKHLTRVHLDTGLVDETEVACDGVADVNGGLALLGASDAGADRGFVTWYPTWEDAVANTAGVTTIAAELSASRIGRGDDTLLFTQVHTGRVQVYDAGDGASRGVIALEAFDTPVWGLSAVGERLFVVNDGRDPGWNHVRIAEFTGEGAAVKDVRIGLEVEWKGLACTADATLLDALR